MVEIIPSVLVKNSEEFHQKMKLLLPHFDTIHLDIADGIFVSNKTIDGYAELSKMEYDISFSVHLMVAKPENHIIHWSDLPVDRISFHTEATNAHSNVINQIKDLDILAGLAISPSTKLDSVLPFVDQADYLHFMTVEPGFYGSAFIDNVVDKIKDFHFMYPDKEIIVDGGITPDNARNLISAGATQLIIGNYFVNSSDIQTAIEDINNIINN